MPISAVFRPFSDPHRYKVAHGGRGCVHKDTLIDTPNGQVKISEFEGGEILSFHNGKIISTISSKPKSYTEEDLFEVKLSNGQSIIVTDEHRFLTENNKWIMTKDLSSSDSLVFAEQPNPLQTNSAYDLSESLEDVQHCSKTPEDSQDHCLLYHHQCDHQPQSLEDTDLTSFPKLNDGQQHNYHASCRLGDQEQSYKDNLSSFLSHLSNPDVPQVLEGRNYVALGIYIASLSFGQILEICQSPLKFLKNKIQCEPFPESLEVLQPEYNLLDQVQSLQTTLNKLTFFSLYNSLFAPIRYHDHHMTVAKIVSIRKHSRQTYWDLHVPIYNNYISNGIINHNSGKSFNIAELLIELSRRQAIRILCARELQNSIDDSVIQILTDAITRLGYDHEFMVLKKSIVHLETGSRFLFYGIKNNPTKIKSLEGVSICWVEEAENVSEESWRILTPTIRLEGSEIWVSFNPKNILDYTYQFFVAHPPKDCEVIQVNWQHNKYISQTLLDEKDDMMERDYDMYLHIWEGKPLADSARAIIKYQWVQASIDLHKKFPFLLDGSKQIGVDVADEGGDKNAVALKQGSTVLSIEEWADGDTGKTSIRAWNIATSNQVDAIVYDSIGVGAGVKAKLSELKTSEGYGLPISILGFNAGGEVENKHADYIRGKTNASMFSNLKAQAWWALRDRFQNTYKFVHEGADYRADELISISSDIKGYEDLMSELSTPLVDYDNNGRVKVESKKDLRKRGIPSHNKADSLAMAYYRCQIKSVGLIC